MKKLLMILLVMSTAFFISCGEDDNDVVECNNVCAESAHGSTQCTSDKQDFETCTKQANGCYEWVKTDCTGEEVCIVAPATDVAACGAGTGDNNVTDCTGDNTACDNNTNGQTECISDVCSTPTTTDPETCTIDGCDSNESGTTQCDGDTVQTCTLQTTLNCYKWENTTDCTTLTPAQVCDDSTVAICMMDVK